MVVARGVQSLDICHIISKRKKIKYKTIANDSDDFLEVMSNFFRLEEDIIMDLGFYTA